MVRTYAFNPSVQHSGDLPGAAPPSFPALTFVPRSRQGRSLPRTLPQNYVPDKQKPNDPYVDHSQYTDMGLTGPAIVQSTSCESMNTHQITPINLHVEPRYPALFDDNTTIMGVQSIVVNGQRYYRPLDDELNRALNEKFSNVKQSFSNRSNVSNGNVDAFNAALNAIVAAQNVRRSQPVQKQIGSNCQNGVGKHQNNNNYLPNASINAQPQRNESPSHDSGIAMDGSDLPWARGSLQPRNGKRGSAGWAQAHRARPAYNSYVPTTDYVTESQANYKPFTSIRSHDPYSIWYGYYPYTYVDLYPRYDDFAMQTSAPKPVDSGFTASNSFSTSIASDPYLMANPYNYGGTIEDQKRWEKEQHRLDLIRQMQDNEHRKRMEKMKEWEEDEKERRRTEATLARQREEVRREEEIIRQKQLQAELKAQQAALEFEQRNREMNVKRKQRSPPPEVKENALQHRNSSASKRAEPALEWWEKKPSWEERAKQTQSPMLPALRNRTNQMTQGRQSRVASRESTQSFASRRSSSTEQPPRLDSRRVSQSRSMSRASRHSYTPSIASRRHLASAASNDSAFRALTETQRRLDEELKSMKRKG